MSEDGGGGDRAGAPRAGQIHHVVVNVRDLDASLAFYRDALGLQEQARLPSAGFLSAGGYHHHVGLNSWQSQGGRPAPENAPGLRSVALELSDVAALEALERRLAEVTASEGFSRVREADGRHTLRDPDDHALVFSAEKREARLAVL